MTEQAVKPLPAEAAKAAASAPVEPLSPLEARKLWAWNRLLLPLMIGMLLGLTLFFFAASLFQLYAVQASIADSPRLDLASSLKAMSLPAQAGSRERQALQRWKTLSLLEEHAVKQRYHQANVLLMARVWVRYLGFVTGMILALVGAVFVLGKLRESRTELSVGAKEKSGSISTQSPGLILVALGTLLMFTTLVTRHEIDVNDGPLYVLLPYSKVELTASAAPVPEDVMKLQTEPTGTDSGQSGEAAARQGLDDTFDQIDSLINTQGQ